jgi:MoaA/NifB/PqqE/SkfB family radical SAM enzyme
MEIQNADGKILTIHCWSKQLLITLTYFLRQAKFALALKLINSIGVGSRELFMSDYALQSHAERKNMIWLEVTNFCNLSCAHCYNSSGSHESLFPTICAERYEQILDEASHLQFRGIQFIGGEPLFYPHLQRLVDRACDLGFGYIEVFSNLTVLPRWLFDHRYREIHLATSFYSDDPVVHDKICGTPRSFERTSESIGRVIEAGFTLRAGFIEMPANKGHFERTRKYLRDLGVTNIRYDRIRQFGRGAQSNAPKLDQLCGRCGNGNLSIDANGNVSACIMSKPWAFGNAREDTLAAIFASRERRSFVDQLNRSQRRLKVDCNPRSEECEPRSCSPMDPDSPSPRCGPGTCGPGDCNPNCVPSEECFPTRQQ